MEKKNKSNKTLVVAGNDKIGHKLIHQLMKSKLTVKYAIDDSSSYKRVVRLLRKRSIGFGLLLKMAIAELFRTDYKLSSIETIKNNSQLLDLIKKMAIERVYLFRAGLIVNKAVLDTGVDILNVHCARIPEYGGIGSIMKAIDNKDFDQEATLYYITESIDDGQVKKVKEYKLEPSKSYRFNEEIAYETGMSLLIEELSSLDAV